MADLNELKRIIARYGLMQEDELDKILKDCPKDSDPVNFLLEKGVLNDRQASMLSKRLSVEAPKPVTEFQPIDDEEDEEIEELESVDPSEFANMARRTEHNVPSTRKARRRRRQMPEPEPITEPVPEPLPLPSKDELHGLMFGEILVELKLVKREDIENTLSKQEELKKLNKPIMLGELMLNDEIIAESEIFYVLSIQGKKLLRCMSCDLHANDSEKENAGRGICPSCFGRLVEKPEKEPFPLLPYNLIRIDNEPVDSLLGAEFKDFLILMPYLRTMSSTVYQGQQTTLGRKVGILVLNHDLSHRIDWQEAFVENARRAARLSFHNIAAGLDVGEFKSRPCYVFEFPEGHSLEDFIIRKGTLGPKIAAKIGFQIGQTMEYCHKNGIWLGAISPAEVFISSGFSVKVIGPGTSMPGLSTGGVELPSGHPSFIAPEVLSGSEPDIGSDMYALGCLLYFASTGVVPARGRNWLDIAAYQIMRNPRPALAINSDVGREMDSLIGKLISKNPEDRFENFEGVLSSLASIAGEKYQTPIDIEEADVPKPMKSQRRKLGKRRRY